MENTYLNWMLCMSWNISIKILKVSEQWCGLECGQILVLPCCPRILFCVCFLLVFVRESFFLFSFVLRDKPWMVFFGHHCCYPFWCWINLTYQKKSLASNNHVTCIDIGKGFNNQSLIVLSSTNNPVNLRLQKKKDEVKNL